MNRKILPCVVFAASAFFLSGCSGSGEDSSDRVTPVDLTLPDTIVGSYLVDFFETSAAGGVFSNDCAQSSLAGGCETLYLVSGYAVISKDDNISVYTLQTQMQILNEFMIMEAPAEVYQYTAYEPIPAANITADGININNGVTGVKGRNLLFTEDNPDSSFYLTYDNATKTLTNNLIIVNKSIAALDEDNNVVSCSNIGDVPVTVKMHKISDESVEIDENSLAVPDASIKEGETIYKPYENFSAEALPPACP